MEEVLETPSRMEPCLLDEVGGPLPDLVADLTFASARLGARLHPDSAAGLADLVRVVNCYYSNLIEGHNTTPRDIERALVNQLDDTEERRNLKLEAQAHIWVQGKIDRQSRAGTLPEPASVDFIQMLHAEFYRDAPDSMLLIGDGNRQLRMVPGAFRSEGEHDVSVGKHVSPGNPRVSPRPAPRSRPATTRLRRRSTRGSTVLAPITRCRHRIHANRARSNRLPPERAACADLRARGVGRP